MIIHQAQAQRMGLLPPSVKWHQLKDDSLRVIFPEGQDEVATRVASLMLKLASVDPISTAKRYKPISVILQPHTNISNGYVGLAPYVSEFYLQANENPFSLGSLPWADLLAIHEYRHVQQVNAANTGFSHIIKLIFGDFAFAGLYSLAIPNWYREGDAVFAETKWTQQGRGRLSNFTLPFHQKLLQGDIWDYYEVRNGSYRHFTPDIYPMGYMMVQYGNHLFGEATWDTIIETAANFKYLLGPMSYAVKARTGLRNKHMYAETMNWYRDKWVAQKEKDVEYPLVTIPEKDIANDYFDMTYPDVDGDGSIYTAITTFDHITAIYQITPEGKRKRIVSMGLQQETFFDHSNHRFVWTELRFDPRWARKDKNVIVVYDQDTGNKTCFTPEKGYYTPSLDRQGAKIVALHEDADGRYQLHLLDARSGAVLKKIPNEKNLYLGYPIWSEDELHIIATARNDQGKMALVQQDITTGEIQLITHYSMSVLGKPTIYENWIFLTTGMDHLDQVYAVDRQEGIFYKVSSGNSAYYNPVYDPVQDAVVSSQFTLKGHKLVRLPGLPRQWSMHNLSDGRKYVPGESGIDLLSTTDERTTFEIKKYSPWANAINFHSISVAVDDPEWGIEARSNNILNTISMAGGYQYNRNSKAGGPYLDVRFGMWYPVFSFGISQTGRKILGPDDEEFRVLNDRVNAGVSLPLTYSSGVFRQDLYFAVDYSAGISKLRPKTDISEDFHFNYLTQRGVFINSRKRAYRQAMPTWAQRVDISYSHEVSKVQISQLYISTDFAVPAILPSHYTLLHGEYLSQDISEGSIQLGSNYQGARGFDELDSEIQYRGGITYGFPIL
ncbi:MAG: hypothetical protein M3R25_14410, partial [Bacteroidota bacterium]|nr:hypothetical protein [Bacteroidota bacterium]